MGNKAKKGRKKVNNIQKSILKTFGLTMVFQGKIKHTSYTKKIQKIKDSSYMVEMNENYERNKGRNFDGDENLEK